MQVTDELSISYSSIFPISELSWKHKGRYHINLGFEIGNIARSKLVSGKSVLPLNIAVEAAGPKKDFISKSTE